MSESQLLELGQKKTELGLIDEGIERLRRSL